MTSGSEPWHLWMFLHPGGMRLPGLWAKPLAFDACGIEKGSVRPAILLVFLTRFEECVTALRGVAHFERTHQIWDAFHDDQAATQVHPEQLRSRRWDGVISRHTTPEFAEACRDLGVPLVDLNDTTKIPGVPKVRPNNFLIGRVAAEHLLERGFRHLAFDGFTEGWSADRRRGFVEAVARTGRKCHVRESPYPGDNDPLWQVQQIEAMADWLAGLPKPCGVMGCADFRARQILVAARSRGLLVPEELAVIGTNNDFIRCELSYPRLSSVETNMFQAGYRAAELLADILRGEDRGDRDECIPPLGVVARQSTDIMAVDDASVARALSIIRERACLGLTTEQLTREAHASRSQLEKKFRQQVGRSPHAEIRRVKIEKVRRLLVETDLPLKHIAELTAFDHVEYMSVVFKRATGLAPGQYRENSGGPKSDPAGVAPAAG